MSACSRSIPLALLLASSLASLSAQQPLVTKKPDLHAGEQVHYDMRVGGSDTDTVTSAYFMLRLSSSSLPDQEDLQSTFTSGWISKSPDGTFHASLVVPQHPASGDYILIVMLRATPGTTIYRYDHSELKVAPVHIDSEDRLKKPEITITERP